MPMIRVAQRELEVSKREDDPMKASIASGDHQQGAQSEDERVEIELKRSMAFSVIFQKSSTDQQAFVRPCYEVLFDLLVKQIERQNQQIAVTGDARIDKSIFYVYCVFQFAKELTLLSGRKLVVDEDDSSFVFDEESAECRELSKREIRKLRWQKAAKVVRLVGENSGSLYK